MTAIVTGNSAAASKLAEFYGIENTFGYDRYDEALESGLFDAVYIGLPNSMHAEYAIRAAEKGIHALVEKPLAVSVAECKAMIDAAEANGTMLMTAYRLHCEPGTVELINQVSQGAIGTPRFFESVFSFQSPESNHRLRAEHWGGPLQDIGVYCLNAARHIFGSEPLEAVAMKSLGFDGRFREVEEVLTTTLRFPEGALATFTVCFNGPDVDMYRIAGTEGEIEMNPGFRFETPTRMFLRRGGEETERTFPDIDQFGSQAAYFSDCILNGEQPLPDGREGLADVQALLAIEEAANFRPDDTHRVRTSTITPPRIPWSG